MKKSVLLATAALLAPTAIALAQEDKLPTAETRASDPSLTPTGPDVPQAVKTYVEDVRKQLQTAPQAGEGKPGDKPGDKGAQKGGAVSVQQELLWEEDLDEFNRQRRARPVAPRKLEGGVSDVHVVQPGDTLWDLSSKYLNSPWVWPRVWSYNPHITNPHWIYPGQVIRFRPLLAAVVESVVPDIVPRPEKVLPGHSGVVAFRHIAFMTKDEIKAAGKLENSPNDQLLLSRFQTAYIAFEKPKEVKVGDKFLTARIEKTVEHPVTGKDVGKLVQITGEIEVTATAPDSKNLYTATMRRSYRTIERGNIVIPYQDLQAKVERRSNAKDLRGYIIANVQRNLVGKYQLSFIDLGQKHGVEYGNLLRIVRRGDGYLREEEFEDNLKKMPLEEVGELLVLEAKPDFSTCLVLRTLVESKVGDKVIMRKGE